MTKANGKKINTDFVKLKFITKELQNDLVALSNAYDVRERDRLGKSVLNKVVLKINALDKKENESLISENKINDEIDDNNEINVNDDNDNNETDLSTSQTSSSLRFSHWQPPRGFSWDESQLDAIDSIISSQFNVLIGSAGSGKTTVVKEVIKRLDEANLILPDDTPNENGSAGSGWNIAFCAFTGKAVEQLRKSVPKELQVCCSTIHSLLEYAPEETLVVDEKGENARVSRIFVPRRDELNPLHKSIIIIDESGMLGVELWNKLTNALIRNSRLKILLIGDINQLPAVIGKSILGYAMGSKLWNLKALTKIHRQALDNPIIANAHRIKQGEFPKVDTAKFRMLNIGELTDTERQKIKSGKLNSSFFDRKNNSAYAQKLVLNLMEKFKSVGYDPDQDQLIVPQNVGDLGCERLNLFLAEMFNPAESRVTISSGGELRRFAVGDKVMFTKNNYAEGILNGMTGYVEEINLNGAYRGFAQLENESAHAFAVNMSEDERQNLLARLDNTFDTIESETRKNESSGEAFKEKAQQQASHCVTIRYSPLGSTADQTKLTTLASAGDINGLLLGYAITCHKAQGSEYRNVVVLCHSASSAMLSREWLYTAVTRARETVTMLYNDVYFKGISRALKRQVIEGATLEEKVSNFLSAEGKGDNQYPQWIF